MHHVESRNVQGAALMKLTFHPGTDMAQALAETVGYVNRARAFIKWLRKLVRGAELINQQGTESAASPVFSARSTKLTRPLRPK